MYFTTRKPRKAKYDVRMRFILSKIEVISLMLYWLTRDSAKIMERQVVQKRWVSARAIFEFCYWYFRISDHWVHWQWFEIWCATWRDVSCVNWYLSCAALCLCSLWVGTGTKNSFWVNWLIYPTATNIYIYICLTSMPVFISFQNTCVYFS